MKNLMVKWKRWKELQIQRELMLKDLEDELGFDISLSEEETIRNAMESFFEVLNEDIPKAVSYTHLRAHET